MRVSFSIRGGEGMFTVLKTYQQQITRMRQAYYGTHIRNETEQRPRRTKNARKEDGTIEFEFYNDWPMS